MAVKFGRWAGGRVVWEVGTAVLVSPRGRTGRGGRERLGGWGVPSPAGWLFEWIHCGKTSLSCL